MAGGESTLIADPVGVPLARLLIQFVVILVSVRFLGWLLKRVKQPIVIGEILAGILLGPSAFGNIPGFTSKLFPNDKAFATASVSILGLFAQIGLIFFMFFLGMEVDGPMMKRSSRQAFPIAMASILVPFGIGAAMAPYLYSLDGGSGDFTSFILFVGTALSFTAFPVLARILSSTNMMKTPLGVLALACAAVNDVMAWCTLAITLSYAAGGSVINGIYTTLIACGFVLFMVLALRPALERVHKYYLDHKDERNRNLLALLFCLLCICSWFAEIVGIHAFFGAFLFGIVVPRQGHLIHEIAPKIELLVVEFFLPLYFANSGLRTDIKGLTGSMWLAAIAFTVAGTVGKIIPVLLASKRFGWDWRESWIMGILMNTRGLVALIVLNIALDNKIISVNSFTILVIMALVTTFMTSPLLEYFYLRVRPVEQQLAAAATKANHAGVTAGSHTSAAELNAQAVHHEKPSSATTTITIPLATIGHEAKSTKPPSPTLSATHTHSDDHHHSQAAASSSLASQARLSDGRTLKVSPSMEALNQAANDDSTIDIDHLGAPLNPQPQAQPQGGFVSLVAEDRSISTRLPPLSAVHWRVIEGSIQPSNN